jgi:hypothetical protein
MDTLAGLRRLLAGILLLGMTGTFVELLLLSHTEDTLQLLPLMLLGCGVAVVAWHAWSRSVPSGLLVRGVMLLFVIAGALGIFFHFEANLEFQREMDATLSGRALYWQALSATVPPGLAPGVMIQFGLLGLAYTYRLKER